MTNPASTLSAPDPQSDGPLRRVVYLLGAGATHGAAKHGGSTKNLLMTGLSEPLLEGMHQKHKDEYKHHVGITHLVNDVVTSNTDFEHVFTFLADTPSDKYKRFAEGLRSVFSTVLHEALNDLRDEVGEERQSALYAALVDMHQVKGNKESLAGFLTLNYDSLLEHAIETQIERTVDYGIRIEGGGPESDSIPVLKLHGSFSWSHTWPIELVAADGAEHWIPPGIRKAKTEYPFNALWGAARELLDCDVVRIIGCRLGPNDWDLVSLLFATMHGREEARPYDVEVIGWPWDADRINEMFPYFNARSLLELPDVGEQLVGEILNRAPAPFADLDPADQTRAVKGTEKISNPFERWLQIKAELMQQDKDLDTPRGLFRNFVEAFS